VIHYVDYYGENSLFYSEWEAQQSQEDDEEVESETGEIPERRTEAEKPHWEQAQKAYESAPFGRSQLGGKWVDPTQLSARTGPPTDRPPD
jgi:hypothetical protein